MRVLIADDHAPTRRVLRTELEQRGIDVCAEAHDARTAVAAATTHRPDVALLDVNMPGSGIDATAAITASSPETVVVMLTVSRSDDDLFRSLRAGAAGYLLKDVEPDRVVAALHAILDGEAVLPRGVVRRMIGEFEQRGRARLVAKGDEELTPREWEVLAMLGEGLTTREIADRLFVATVTVRSHVAAINRKLRVKDRSEAVDRFKGAESDTTQ